MDDPNNFCIDFGDRGFLRSSGNLIDPPIISVYLASPLTNTTADSNECAQVRAAIKLALADYEYLGVKFHVYDPADHTAPASEHTPEQVYVIDHRCTVCADLVVFLVNAPSLGVGIEAQLSASATTPRVVIKKRTVPTSRLFQGMVCSTLAEIEYDVPAEVFDALLRLLSEICPKAIESAESRRPNMAEIEAQHLGKQFLQRRIQLQIPLSEVSRQTDIQEWWLDQLERCPEFSSTISIAQIWRIGEVLKCHANVVDGKIEIVDHSEALAHFSKESLSNLAEFVRGRATINEQRVFELWDSYLEETRRQDVEAAAFRGSVSEGGVVSVAEWRKRYDDRPLLL